MTDNITHLGNDMLMQEAQSQADRILNRVMKCLYLSIPDKDKARPSFNIDGMNCFIKKFYEPTKGDEGEMKYGFDVEFDSGPLSHLEFKVTCSGWERSLLNVSEDQNG